LLAGVVDCAVVVIGFRLGGPRGGRPGLRAIPSRWCCMKPCGRAPAGPGGREATQFVDRTRGWVMALAGLHEVLVTVLVLVMFVVAVAFMPRPW
jgi:hypothetical protein